MPDVFISYSRKDKEFVRRLNDSLAETGRDIWVDWEDIPLTADWWQEIVRGIEAADAFVCIITPDSMRSAIVRDEIAIAEKNNKRVVPILHREIVEQADKDVMPAIISAHNWLFFRDEDDYDGAFAGLVSALDTDLDYRREHTRLLVRAHEWENNGRERSKLLDGTEIVEAEGWLSGGMGKTPPPTELHSEYIFASRANESRRQRTLLGWGAVVLAAMTVLAIVAVLLYRQSEVNLQAAQEARARAENQRQLAQSVGLAAQVQLELGGNAPERGLLLALEALENYAYTWEAERALGIAIQNSPLRAILEGHTREIYSAEWSPDGTRIVTTGADATVRVWDVNAGEQLLEIEGLLRGAVWSPDGTRILASNGDFARIMDAETGEDLLTVRGLILAAEWSPDGTHIMTSSLEGQIIIWDAATGEQILVLEDQSAAEIGSTRLFTWSADGEAVATVNDDNNAVIWSVATGEPIYTLTGGHRGAVNSIAWSPDGNYVLTAGEDGRAIAWDAQNGLPEQAFNTNAGPLRRASWAQTSNRIVTFSQEGAVSVWSLDQGDELFISEALSSSASIAPDGDYIVTTYDQELVSIWEVEIGGALLTFIGDTRSVDLATWSPTGQLILTASGDGTLKVWDASPNGEVATFIEHEDRIEDAAWSPDGTRVVTASGDETARVWDAETGQQIHIFSAHTDIVESVDWSPDGTTIATAGWDGMIRLWDAETGQPISLIIAHDDVLKSVQWSPDGDYLVSASDDGTAKLWDMRERPEIIVSPSRVLSGHSDVVISADWAPDGETILTASRDSTARIWDFTSGQELLNVGSGERLHVAAWSPDGSRFATADRNGHVFIWDSQTGDALYLLDKHLALVHDLTWSPDGTRIVTSSFDTTARVWNLTEADQQPASDEGETVSISTVANDVPVLDSELILFGHEERAYSAIWTPNGERIITSDAGGAIRVWNVGTADGRGQQLRTIPGHRDDATDVIPSPDGERFVTISLDGRAKVWWGWQTTENFVAHARACCAVRELSRQERSQFGLPPLN